MIFLKVILTILIVLLLISHIRLGAIVRYNTDGLAVSGIAGPLRKRIFPVKEGKLRRKKAKKDKRRAAEEREAPAGGEGTLSRLMQLLPVAGEAAGTLKQKIRIDNLELSLVWGGKNAANIALGYGWANMAIGMIWPVFDHNFKVKNYGFHTELDYGRTEPVVDLYVALTITVRQIVALGLRYGLKALMIWSRSGERSIKKQGGTNHE